MINDWQSSIAHPDMADWITVLAYLLAAILAARAATHARLRREVRERVFWRITAVLLVFLGINELFDLQTLLAMVARAHAKANGWYPEHRKIQYMFIVGLGVTALFAGVAMLWLTRRAHVAVQIALAGLLFIGLFVLVRAASFHHVDEILVRGSPQFNWGAIQEMAGIVLVAGAAAFYTRRRQRGTRRSSSRGTM